MKLFYCIVYWFGLVYSSIYALKLSKNFLYFTTFAYLMIQYISFKRLICDNNDHLEFNFLKN